MMIEHATLLDGRSAEFLVVDDPPSGAMKKTYFTPDKSHVIQFYHDQSTVNDLERIPRLEAILNRFNPTLDSPSGEYWKKLFCWPTGIVIRPQLGIMAPAYPNNFFFHSGQFKNSEKQGKWFSSPRLRIHLSDVERGTWINYFQICILIARAVRRLHQAGLAHSDLSGKNILIDPSAGRSIVIDIDSLVVPQIFPPDVMGTRGYIAPEVLRTQSLTMRNPNRQHPSVRTDLHALAVLIYEYLLFRHPLEGPKVHSTASAEQDDLLSLGKGALFVEHPGDHSNRPADLQVPYTVLGPYLANLITKAFIDGLHVPNLRPAAIEWEGALISTWNLLHPCVNSACTHKWFVLHDVKNVRCSFCGAATTGSVPVLKLQKEIRPGQWIQDNRLVVYHNLPLHKWHAYSNVFPGENADRARLAYCALHEGKWLLVNEGLLSLTSPSGSRVPLGQAVELKDGAQIRLSQEPSGRLAEVQIVHP